MKSFAKRDYEISPFERLANRETELTQPHATLLDHCKIGDRQIAGAVTFAVCSTATAPQEKVRLKVKQGYVTLEGQLYSWKQKELLQSIVQNVPGVKGITNLIKIGF